MFRSRNIYTLDAEQAAELRECFLPDRPGPLVGLHVLQTGHGSCHVDRWPAPRVVVMETGGNYELLGEPGALDPDWMARRLRGFAAAPEAFFPAMRRTFPGLAVWDREILWIQEAPAIPSPEGFSLRRLTDKDAHFLAALSPELGWITLTWGGPPGLAASGMCWGAFRDGQLASVACPFFVGHRFEDIGVVTERRWRGRGLATAAAARLCADILQRGRRPSWSTSPDNLGSLRVAGKMGFRRQRSDRLYALGVPVPAP